MNIFFVDNLFRFRAILYILVLITLELMSFLFLIDFLGFEGYFAQRAKILHFFNIAFIAIFSLTFIDLSFRSFSNENFKKIILQWIILFSLFIFVLFAFRITEDFSRTFLGTIFLGGLVINIITMIFSIFFINKLNLRNVERILLIGEKKLMDSFAGTHETTIYEIDNKIKDSQIKTLEKFLLEKNLSKVIICRRFYDPEETKALHDILKSSTADIYLYIRSNNSLDISEYKRIRFLGEPIFLIGENKTVDKRFQILIKRIFDFIISFILIIVLLPLLFLISILIKINSPGPILYTQKRNGIHGRYFKIYKFRTMKYLKKDIFIQAKKDDERVTLVGSFLRKTSFDELPQLVNILFGEMSLVGPRPHAHDHNLEFAGTMDSYMSRHRVKPGITGLAQIRGFRGETARFEDMQKRVDSDIEYIKNWNIFLDFKIILLTPLSLLKHRAY